jgi:glyoxylase-like metal-dependent hydrolase (beta-lactamase superfamily II)
MTKLETAARCAVAAAILPLVFGVGAGAQPEPPPLADVVIDTVDLGGGVHMIVGFGGNIAVLVGEDGVLMVDDQVPPLAGRIVAAIEALGGGDVRFVLNTHYHRDHNGANEDFARAGATILAHDNARRRIMGHRLTPGAATGEPRSEEAWPVVTYSEDVTFHMNGQTVHAFHVPRAHTDGDTIVYFEEANVLHMGDVMNYDGLPYTDVDAGGSLDGVIAGLTRALGVGDADTRVITGHGTRQPVAMADLEAYRDGLAEMRAILAPLAASDMSVEDIVASEPLAAYWAAWGAAYEQGGFPSLVPVGPFTGLAIRAMRDGAIE